MAAMPVIRRWLLYAVAVAYAAWTLFYAGAWIYASRRMPAVELGFENTWIPAEHAMRVDSVVPGSPAAQSGMRTGDRLKEIDGRPIDSGFGVLREWLKHKPGDRVEMTVVRKGQPGPILLTGIFRPREPDRPLNAVSQWVQYSFPVPFVLVGLAVLFLRPASSTVWLLALLCGCFAATPGFPDQYQSLPASLRPIATSYQALFLGQLGAVFFWFFARFPMRSVIDRRLPWLKWLAVGIGISVSLPGLGTGRLEFPFFVDRIVGRHLDGDNLFWVLFSFLVLGMCALVGNFIGASDPAVRRKIRVIFWGTVLGISPALVRAAAENISGVHAPPAIDALTTVILFLFPLSFAYAVVKHRVLEIPVLIQRSARYLLVQRGFVLLLSLVSIGLTLLFAFNLESMPGALGQLAEPLGITLGAVFGTALLWSGTQVHRRVASRIDRAFFRSAYDGRVILEDLASRLRSVQDRHRLAGLLEEQLRRALHPCWMAVYLEAGNGDLEAVAGDVPEGQAHIPGTLPLLAELAEQGRPWEVTAAPPVLAAAKPDFLVPIPGLEGRLAGLIVLGQRLSEEPYSGEDRRLLVSVANQAGTALENFRLAAEIAARMERERRVAREMEIAQEVQSRLLPEAAPELATLELAARCVQARAVGGDYYDFLDLGQRRAGLVLGDISGKGVHAALLMANLQAHLRSQSSAAPSDPAAVLQAVNRTLRQSTAGRHFATLFFGSYDDANGRLRYVNCGHNPPILLRSNRAIERLPATATVIGVFPAWDCSIAEVPVGEGDLLVIFSDGVTEAARGEEEFGEARLLEVLAASRDLPVTAIVETILKRVLEFSAGEQSDDLTLLVARGCRANAH